MISPLQTTVLQNLQFYKKQ